MEKTKKASKFKIDVHREKCTGCIICQLECSFVKLGVFNPAESRILIYRIDDDPQIEFTDECDNCGICARLCPYGALVLVRSR